MAEDCDALVVVTEWQQFRTLDLARLGSVMHTRILVDGRNLFLPEEALAAGFDYSGIGRCARPRAAEPTPPCRPVRPQARRQADAFCQSGPPG